MIEVIQYVIALAVTMGANVPLNEELARAGRPGPDRRAAFPKAPASWF